MVMNVNVTVHTYCHYCDAIIETNTFMELSEFSKLQENDPETYYINEEGEYFINLEKICSYHDLEV